MADALAGRPIPAEAAPRAAILSANRSSNHTPKIKFTISLAALAHSAMLMAASVGRFVNTLRKFAQGPVAGSW